MMTRRDFARTTASAALAAAPASAKPDSRFSRVQIGTITYSFRAIPHAAEDIVRHCVELGINSVELMGDAAETYAGMPAELLRNPGRRSSLTPEQQEAARRADEERKRWRTSASTDKYKALRRLFNDAGVRIDHFKLPITAGMSNEECDYAFQVAKVLGAHSLTMELPAQPEFSQRVGEFAAKHKVYAGYHNHMQVNASSWDTALAQSRYNSINLDVGHYSEAISASPIPFIREKASRITSFHLKDKKFGVNGGGNTVWGSGQTGLRDILQLMKKEKYEWSANIELEYEIPAGSTVMAEMARCVRFCKDALA